MPIISLSELEEKLKSDDSFIREVAISDLEKIDKPRATKLLLNHLRDPVWKIRQLAANILKKRVNSVLPDIEKHLKTFNDEDTIYWCTRVLAQAGDKSLPIFESLLLNKNSEIRYYAVNGLSLMSAPSTIPLLVKCLSDESWIVRNEAANALYKYGETAINYLKSQLASGNKDVRFWTIKLLAKILKEKALPFLKKAMKSDNPELRYNTIIALSEIKSDTIIPILINCLSDSSWIVRRQAAETLKKIGKSSIPFLKQAFKSGNSDIKYWTIKLFGNILKEEAIDDLKRIMEESNEKDMRYYAITALGEIKHEKAVRHLVNAFQDELWTLRKHAATLLSHMGNFIVPILDKIVDETENADILHWISELLIGFETRAIPIILKILKKSSKKIRMSAIVALKEIVSQIGFNKKLAQELIPLLEDPYWPIRKETANIFIIMGPDAVPDLLPAMGQNRPDIDYWGDKIIESLGEAAFDTIYEIFDNINEIDKFFASINSIDNKRFIDVLLKFYLKGRDGNPRFFNILTKCRGDGVEYLKEKLEEVDGPYKNLIEKVITVIASDVERALPYITIYSHSEHDNIFEFFLKTTSKELKNMSREKLISLLGQVANIRTGYIHTYLSEYGAEPLIKAIKEWLTGTDRKKVKDRVEWIRKKARYYSIVKNEG